MLNYQRVNLHFPMVFLWFSCGFPNCPMGFPLVYQRRTLQNSFSSCPRSAVVKTLGFRRASGCMVSMYVATLRLQPGENDHGHFMSCLHVSTGSFENQHVYVYLVFGRESDTPDSETCKRMKCEVPVLLSTFSPNCRLQTPVSSSKAIHEFSQILFVCCPQSTPNQARVPWTGLKRRRPTCP